MKAGNKGMVRLHGHFNNYSWGKMGHNSEVARLFQAGHKDFRINPDQPYSEVSQYRNYLGCISQRFGSSALAPIS